MSKPLSPSTTAGDGQTSSGNEAILDEAAVVNYLLEDKDFFTRHPSVLAQLVLPHQSGNTVSLVEHQVSILRERNMDSRRRMNELVQAARENDEIFAKTRSLTLALLDAQNLPALNEVLATHLLVDFEADFVCCHTVAERGSLDHIRSHRNALPFAGLLGKDKAICSTLRRDELETIFPNSSHADTGSAVLIPLDLPGQQDQPIAALCIGSRDAQRFSKDLDTLFVTYIADVLAKVLKHL